MWNTNAVAVGQRVDRGAETGTVAAQDHSPKRGTAFTTLPWSKFDAMIALPQHHPMVWTRTTFIGVALAVGVLAGCGGSGGGSSCSPGTLDCPCHEADRCDEGLRCRLDVCVDGELPTARACIGLCCEAQHSMLADGAGLLKFRADDLPRC